MYEALKTCFLLSSNLHYSKSTKIQLHTMYRLLKQFLLTMLFGLRDNNVEMRGNDIFERKERYDPFLKTVELFHPSHGWNTGHSKLPPEAAALPLLAQNGIAWAFAEI